VRKEILWTKGSFACRLHCLKNARKCAAIRNIYMGECMHGAARQYPAIVRDVASTNEPSFKWELIFFSGQKMNRIGKGAI
jgi:hypothetical protein